MTQHELNRRVARATGEPVDEIRRRGFSLADPLEVGFDPEPGSTTPQVIDWDQMDAERRIPLVLQRVG